MSEPAKSEAPSPATQGPATGSFQFDSKGVDFSPWLRRFVAQVQRNWYIPQSAMNEKGQTVVKFRVHKDGRISAVAIATPSAVDAFNNSAFGAVIACNPTAPLPPEYPDENVLFTVVFYFNETPPKAP